MSDGLYLKIVIACFLKDLAYAGLFIKMYSMNTKWWLYLLVILTFPYNSEAFKKYYKTGGDDECKKSM